MNTVTHGDCLEIMPTLPDKSIDMVMCDLPYGTTACKWDAIIPLEPLWKEYKRLIKDSGAIVLTAQDKFSARLMLSNEAMHRYNLVWKKNRSTGFLNANRMPLRSHEDILVFYKKLSAYNPQMQKGLPNHSRGNVVTAKNSCYGKFNVAYESNRTGDMKYPCSILPFDREHPPIHPTQKPVALFEYLIRTYTNEGETVLDNCAGSGTTAIACIRTNRNYILIEKEQKYIDIINQRIEKEREQMRLI